MLTYRLQNRKYKVVNGGVLAFPNHAVLEVKLGPPQMFGAGEGPCRFCFDGEKSEIVHDPTTGLLIVRPERPLPPIHAAVSFSEIPEIRWELKGDILRCEFECKDDKVLLYAIFDIYYVLVPLLNIGFSEPPFVIHIRGWLADTEFYWTYCTSSVEIDYGPRAHLNELAAKSIDHLRLFKASNNRRLALALHYFHVACRLLVVGQSPWEFMAECVLNMTKSLEVLFGDSRDEVRGQLRRLGYSTEEIEGDFMVIMILRSFMDVAHVKIAVPNSEQLQVLYKSLERSRRCLSKLFERVILGIERGTFQVNQIRVEDILVSDRAEQKKMDGLIASISARLAAVDTTGLSKE